MKKPILPFSILILLLLSCSSGGSSEETSSFSSSNMSSSSSESVDSHTKTEDSEKSSLEESSESSESISESSSESSLSIFESESEESSLESSSEEESFSSISESIDSSSSEIIPDSYVSKYDIVYDLGTRKTSYPFKADEGDLVKECFAVKDNDEDIISSVDSFNSVYGGGYGGSGDNAWISGNLLKLGTTSVNSELTLSLTKKIDKVKITGMVSVNTLKVDINGNEITCTDMALANKETIDNKTYTSFMVEISESNTLSIKTTNKKVLYISSIELSYEDDIPVITEKYTVTWKNYDGAILEIDYDVPQGSAPKYDGGLPTKESDEDNNYVFSGWNPKVGPIYEDTTYIATYTPVSIDEKIRGSEPILSADEKTIEYGIYPQKHIDDESLVSVLDSLTLDDNNRVLYNNEYYLKADSNVYNNESYCFDNGNSIIIGSSYWFKCETINWNVISSKNNVLTLISESLIQPHNYYKDYQNRTIDGNIVYPNNYQESDVRNYLNNVFLMKAFFLGEDSIITNDNGKIYLPSIEEVNELDTKTAKTTDYSRATGAFSNKESSYLYNGSYWTRTPSENFAYCVYNVNSGGVLSEYTVDGTSHCIRPCIKITLNS